MEKIGTEDKSKELHDKNYPPFTVGPIGVAPDGGMVPNAMPRDAPARDRTTLLCMAGPCRFYWQVTSPVDALNPDESWADLKDPDTGLPLRKPRQFTRSCLTHPGTETQLTADSLVEECNRWDPLTEEEINERETRRNLYQIRANKENQ